jgi:Icc protein
MGKSTYELLQLTDPHYLADPDGLLKDVHTRSSFRRVLEAALADTPRPDAILLTGDVTQDGSREGYLAIREDLARFGVPVWSLPGNHDDPAIMAEILGEPPFEYCRPQRLGDWLIAMVDTWDGDRGGGRVGEAGLEALDWQLGASDAPHAMVCLHHQPTPVGCAWLDGVGLDDGPSFMDLVGRHPRVRGLLWGHVHQLFDEQRGAMRLMSTPSTCFQFVPRQDEFGIDPAPPGYRHIRLHVDGRIESDVRRVPGAI